MLKLIPMGGLGEIGLNMMALEYEDTILVVDAGLMFPEDYMLGVDVVIPDFGYLREKPRPGSRRSPDPRPRRPHRRHALSAP